MQIPLDEEQATFASVVREVLVRTDPPGERTFDPGTWAQLVAGGFLDAVSADEPGGTVFLGLLAEEVGRAANPVPVTASVVLAGHALSAAGADEDQVAALRGGHRLAALLLDVGQAWETPVFGLATGGDQLVVSGSCAAVLGAGIAEVWIVPARHLDGGTCLVRVDPAASGAHVARSHLDLTGTVATVTLEGCPATPLHTARDVATALDAAFQRAALADAGEMVGAAQRCLDLTVAHLTTRRQFGRPIGTFQALQHRCAELVVDIHAARSAVRWACRAADGGDPLSHLLVAGAQAVATRALQRAAEECMQMHGGMGFTWEHDAHGQLRRATSGRWRFGTAEVNLARIAGGLQVPAPPIDTSASAR
ncbi:acyl-CoA dehydrogenase family protein [Euzebya sp.]|uniref:acyl-CoA dehydrogenase family protein n=1 Tax=Euzebya sp. TaxID=1971409 RepID=UPI0035163279